MEGEVCVVPVTERCAVALGDLLHLVVVSQHKECLLEFAHLLHFGHHGLVDSIHNLLHTSGTLSVNTSDISNLWCVAVYYYLLTLFEGLTVV